MKKTDQAKTLRLLFPQWQGGGNPAYIFGAEMLNWLAPNAAGPVERVPVAEPGDKPLKIEKGIFGRRQLLLQLADARRLIDQHQPERIVTLGGDCLVDLAPFAYLNEHYEGNLAVLWVDTHPDVMTKDVYQNAHAMVMGNLLGEGDPEFVAAVKLPIKPCNVMFVGRLDTFDSLPDVLAMETALFARLDLKTARPDELAESSAPVLEWLRSVGAKHVAVHFDLDVLDPSLFRSLLFANPDPGIAKIEGSPSGKMTMAQVIRLLKDVANVADVVGLGITEHLPWDSMALKSMLSELPLIGSPTR